MNRAKHWAMFAASFFLSLIGHAAIVDDGGLPCATPEALRSAVERSLRRGDPGLLTALIEPDPADPKASQEEADSILKPNAPDAIVSLRTLEEFESTAAESGPIHHLMPDAVAGRLFDWITPPTGEIYVEKSPGNGRHLPYAKVGHGYMLATATSRSLNWKGPPDHFVSYSFELKAAPGRNVVLHVAWTASGVKQEGEWTLTRTLGGQVLVGTIDALDLVRQEGTANQPFRISLDGTVVYETKSLPSDRTELYRRSPSDSSANLASTDPAAREQAAALIRRTYRAPSRERWNFLLAQLRVGETHDDAHSVLNGLTKTSVEDMWENGMHPPGSQLSEAYRLDDRWILSCHWDTGRLAEFFVSERMRAIFMPPPSDFLGTWTTYYVNGQPEYRIDYDRGRYSGEFRHFYPNGGIMVIQHYGLSVAEGDEIDYFLSGRVSFRGRYHANKMVGDWIWYNEDGSVRKTQHF